MPAHLSWIRPPRQQRSQETLERILDAAEALIIEQGVDQTTVTEVARRADSSVGALYARFDGKEALLAAVFERFYEQAIATADHVFDARHWAGQPTDKLVRAAIALMLRIFRERQKLIAGFTLRAAKSETLGALGERLGNEVASRVHQLFTKREERISHANPEQAIRFAVLVVLSALEARALYSPEMLREMPEDDVARELTRMCLSYLGIGPDSAPREKGTA